MAKIKRLGLFDIPGVKKMMSFLGSEEMPSLAKLFILIPCGYFQSILPIKLKKLPESFVSIENRILNGMVSLQPTYGNSYKWCIRHLYLNKNSYLAGRQLLDFILAKFGAQGANTFTVSVDDNQEELLDLFSKGCGFRLCSHESLWKADNFHISQSSSQWDIYRPFKNSDAKEVCELFNDSIFPHFRYSLSKVKAEFYDRFFQGLSKKSFFKYVASDAICKKIKGYIEIETEDNTNFMMDVILHPAYEDSYPELINFALTQISRRKREFNLFIYQRKYMITSKKLEEFLKENNAQILQNNVVLVKDFFKTIKQEEKIAKPAIAFSDIKGKPAFSSSEK